MKKLYSILNSGLLGRNGALLCAIVAFILTGFFAASCAKTEIAQDDAIAKAVADGSAAEGQDDPTSGEQGNPDDPNPGDPSNPDGPAQHGSDYISPDQFNLIPVSFNAYADEDNASQGPAQAGAFGATKALFSMEDAASREEPLDEEAEGAESAFGVKTTLGDDNKISWIQGDKLKLYYYKGTENFTTATVKHDGATSTFDGLVNPVDKCYYAFYPNNDEDHCPVTTTVTYEGDATYANGAMTITIPSTQNGAFENCHLAVGKATAEDKQFTFSNVGSYMKLKVANTTATALTIQATNTSDKIVGTFTVPFAAKGLGIDEKNITLGECSCSLRVNLPTPRAANTIVYVALLPGVDFTDGFRIRYEYGDSKVHPGFAYVKRTGVGARTSRSVDRKKILNFATASVPTLDERIREEYFVKTTGSCSDVDVTRAGASWSNALNVTGLRDLLAQPVDGSGNQITDEDHDRAWMLDGATIHIAKGDYYLAGSAENFEVKMEFASYPRQVAVAIKGGYPSNPTGSSPWGRDTTVTDGVGQISAFTGNSEAGVLWLASQTNITFEGITFKNASFSSVHAALHVDSGVSGASTVTLKSCRFLDNSNTYSYASAGIYVGDGTAGISNCYFARNYARNGSCINLGTGTGTVTVADCLFERNSTLNTSGAVQNAGKTATITGCTFDHNVAGDYGGGAFHGNGTGSTTTFNTCTFSNNSAAQGGAVSIQRATATFNNCSFTSNSASKGDQKRAGNGELTSKTGTAIIDNVAGGAIILHHASANCTLNNCTFTGNTAPNGCGGAIGFEDVAATLNINAGTSFTNNTAFFHGGAIHALGGGFTITGTSASKVTFTSNKTLSTGNQVAQGGAIWVGPGANSTMTYAKFDRCEAGQEDDENVKYSNGGAISFNATDATTTFSADHCEFTGCRARNGGVLLLRFASGEGNSCVFTDCSFHDNIGRSGVNKDGTVHCFWGAVACFHASCNAKFVRCTLEDNVAYNGTGVFHMDNEGASLTLEDCTIARNSSLIGNAGVICLHSNGASLTATGCTFTGNSANSYGGVLYIRGQVESDPMLNEVTLENCVFDGNHADRGAALCSESQTFFKMNGCLFKNNYTASRGVIYCLNGQSLLYLSRVTFHQNYTTNTNGWGVNIHPSAGIVCMNNVTSYDNYCSNANPGSCAAFNSDGSWLITNSTIMDRTPLALVRANISSGLVTVHNNIFMNLHTTSHTVYMPKNTAEGAPLWNNRGHNYFSSTKDQNAAYYAPIDDATDWKDHATFRYGGNYHEVFQDGKYKYAVYDGWTYDETYSWLLEVTTSSNPITTTMGEHFNVSYSPRSITNVGYAFYEWLNSFGDGNREYMKDGRNVYRPTPTAENPVRWVFGAYQASTNN